MTRRKALKRRRTTRGEKFFLHSEPSETREPPVSLPWCQNLGGRPGLKYLRARRHYEGTWSFPKFEYLIAVRIIRKS